MAKKPDGKYRFCVNHGRLNEIIVNKVTPVPTVSEIFGRLQKAKLFTVLDLRSGYWQFPIRKGDWDKATFSAGDKQYRFKRMPFGLSGAPFTFGRLMLKVLQRLTNAIIYRG
ncbi:unnamed protein product [Calicophoron daubneyi]|uniref:Reverse transcriptase domain-containing protein n=1 Tax=Calicophoron daubneyi TaxID=300641 RepID=A0AAV2T8W6_CALDB